MIVSLITCFNEKNKVMIIVMIKVINDLSFHSHLFIYRYIGIDHD